MVDVECPDGELDEIVLALGGCVAEEKFVWERSCSAVERSDFNGGTHLGLECSAEYGVFEMELLFE